MAKRVSFKAGDRIRLKDPHTNDIDAFTVVKTEYKYNQWRGDDATIITIKGVDGQQHQIGLDDALDQLVESKKAPTMAKAKRPQFKKFVTEEALDAGEILDVVDSALEDMHSDYVKSPIMRQWDRGLQSAIMTLQQHSQMNGTPLGKKSLNRLITMRLAIKTLASDVTTPANKMQAAKLLYLCYVELAKLIDDSDVVLESKKTKKTVVKEGFDDDEDELPVKRTISIAPIKAAAVTSMIKAMNPQKQGYAERLWDWIQSGGKAGQRPSAISFGLGSYSATSVEQAFQAIDVWPKGVRI